MPFFSPPKKRFPDITKLLQENKKLIMIIMATAAGDDQRHHLLWRRQNNQIQVCIFILFWGIWFNIGY